MALIECPECHKEISDKASSCPHCGYPVKQDSYKDEYLCCPKCHSRELHSEQQGFNGGKALAGTILAGGVGILAGTIGSKNVNITCLKCGHRFKAGEALIEKGERAQKEMENKIASLLRDDKLVDALNLYRNETHQEFKPSMDYIHEVARKYNIEIKQNKGCSILLMFLLAIASSITILFC